MKANYTLIFLTAIIPLFVGTIWYNPKVLGTIWMKEAGIKTDDPKPNMFLLLGLTYVLGLMLSLSMYQVTIHQMGLYAMFQGNADALNPATELGKTIVSLMEQYGTNFRSFKHGALHGSIMGVFFALPIIAINALFERRGGKYILIHFGYWVITLALIGGVVCGWA